MTTAEASFSGSRLLARGAIGPGQATPKAWVTQTGPEREDRSNQRPDCAAFTHHPRQRIEHCGVRELSGREPFAGPLSKRHIYGFAVIRQLRAGLARNR